MFQSKYSIVAFILSYSDSISAEVPGLFRSDGSLGGLIHYDDSFVLLDAAYVANASILILDGGMLEIGPNATIEFANGCSLVVKDGGKLTIGSSVLKPQTGSVWGGIILENTNKTSISDSELIGASIGVKVKSNGNLHIYSSTIKDMTSSAVNIESSSDQSTIVLSNVRMDHTGSGVYAQNFQGLLSLSNSTLVNVSQYGVYAYGYSSSWYYRKGRIALKDNDISMLDSSSSTAVYIQYFSNATILKNIVTCGYYRCLYLYNGNDAVVEDNVLSGTDDSSVYYYEQGYFYMPSASSFRLQRNVFRHYKTSTSRDALYIDVGQSSGEDGSIAVKDNLFYNISAGKNYMNMVR